jgi:hypothetical protein
MTTVESCADPSSQVTTPAGNENDLSRGKISCFFIESALGRALITVWASKLDAMIMKWSMVASSYCISLATAMLGLHSDLVLWLQVCCTELPHQGTTLRNSSIHRLGLWPHYRAL